MIQRLPLPPPHRALSSHVLPHNLPQMYMDLLPAVQCRRRRCSTTVTWRRSPPCSELPACSCPIIRRCTWTCCCCSLTPHVTLHNRSTGIHGPAASGLPALGQGQRRLHGQAGHSRTGGPRHSKGPAGTGLRRRGLAASSNGAWAGQSMMGCGSKVAAKVLKIEAVALLDHVI